jgi:hypothetical protein
MFQERPFRAPAGRGCKLRTALRARASGVSRAIGPHVREMDEAGVFRKDLLQEMFQLGLMGIEIPEAHGGQGGNFFQSILAVEALAAVDPSAAVIVDVQNTIANNILLRWGNEDQKRRYLPKLARDTVAAFALSEAGSGSDAFAMGSRATQHGDQLSDHRPQALDHQRRGSRHVPFCSPTLTPTPAIVASLVFWWSAALPDFRWARKKTNSAFALPPPAS